jgi:DNA-binding XRE family transcriptional regulator
VPSDERKPVGPDAAKPRKHDTGRGIILRIIRGGTPVLGADQHPVDSLMLRLVGDRPSPHRHGVVHVRSHWHRLPRGPGTGPPRRGSRVSWFLEWFHGHGDIVHGYPGNRVPSERALRRDALAKKVGTSRECVRQLEAGVYELRVETLQRLAAALGVQ